MDTIIETEKDFYSDSIQNNYEKFIGSQTELWIKVEDNGSGELGWRETKEGESYSLNNPLFNGLKALWVFSSEQNLLAAYEGKKTAPLRILKMGVSVLVGIAKANGFEVIIHDLSIPFYYKTNNSSHVLIPEGTKVLMGIPAQPIPHVALNKVINIVKKATGVEEIYHYLQVIGSEKSFVICILSNKTTEKEKEEIGKRIQSLNIFDNLDLSHPVDFNWVTKDSETYQILKNSMKDALIYKKKNGFLSFLL